MLPCLVAVGFLHLACKAPSMSPIAMCFLLPASFAFVSCCWVLLVASCCCLLAAIYLHLHLWSTKTPFACTLGP